MTHTETPWFVDDLFGRQIYSKAGNRDIVNVVNDTGGGTPFEVWSRKQDKIDAAHIVKCVNEHDTLTKRVAELEKALKIVKCELWDLPCGERFSRTLHRTRLESITDGIEQTLKKGESDDNK